MTEDPRLEALRLQQEALSRRAEGNVTGAFARYRRVLETAERLDDRKWQAEILTSIAEMYQDAFDLPEARLWYDRALPVVRDLGLETQAGYLVYRTAQVAQLSGSVEEAEELFREAAGILEAAGDAHGAAVARAGLGELLWQTKRESAGIEELVRAHAVLRDAAPAEAARLVEKIRSWRPRAGSVRYRRLIEEGVADPSLRVELLRPG